MLLNLSSRFCLLSHQKWKTKASIFVSGIFIIAKIKIRQKQEKRNRVWRECIDQTPVSELISEILISKLYYVLGEESSRETE
jgi:fructose-1,6-bisphosphatase